MGSSRHGVQADTALLSGPNDTTAHFFLTGANCKYRMQIDVVNQNLPTLGSGRFGFTIMAGSGDHLYVIRGQYLVRVDLNGHGEVLADQDGKRKAWGGSTCGGSLGHHLYIIRGGTWCGRTWSRPGSSAGIERMGITKPGAAPFSMTNFGQLSVHRAGP
jgi:hypothetical protein